MKLFGKSLMEGGKINFTSLCMQLLPRKGRLNVSVFDLDNRLIKKINKRDTKNGIKSKIGCILDTSVSYMDSFFAYDLNTYFKYEPHYRHDDSKVKEEEDLYICMKRLVKDVAQRNKVSLQLADFHYVRGISFTEHARDYRKVLLLEKWWEMFGDRTPSYRGLLFQLSLTCSSFGC